MNYMVAQKIQEYERASNDVEKVVKICQCVEFIIMYYAAIFYCHSKADNLVNKEILEIILTNFHKKNPLLSSWIKLLRASLELCSIDQSDFEGHSGTSIQHAARSFLPDSSKREIIELPVGGHDNSPTFLP